MAERNLDFDKITDRRNTNCLKYDFASEKRYAGRCAATLGCRYGFSDIFLCQDALIKQVQHGIFGYSDGQEILF